MYYLVYGLLYMISLLPTRALYVVSDICCFFIYTVFGYRKEVVRNNLSVAFPEKSIAERRRIEKQFYKNFTDNFIETIKLISGGSRFAQQHFSGDGTLMQEQFHKGNRCQFHLGHHFNWEIVNIGVSSITDYPLLMVYLPVKNNIFERVMRKLRSASGNHLLPATDMRNSMMPFRNTQYLLALIADQVPGDVSKAYWLNFFGQPTPFLRGPERGAVAGNISVLFAHIYKTGRGQYQLEYELCTEDPASLPKGEITRRYVAYLEKAIRKHPDMWLWSHRRWKKTWKEEYGRLWIDHSPLPSV